NKLHIGKHGTGVFESIVVSINEDIRQMQTGPFRQDRLAQQSVVARESLHKVQSGHIREQSKSGSGLGMVNKIEQLLVRLHLLGERSVHHIVVENVKRSALRCRR